MNKEEIEKILKEEIKPVWSCHIGQFHEIGCPHQEWTKEQLLDVLIRKKKFEASGIQGITWSGETIKQ